MKNNYVIEGNVVKVFFRTKEGYFICDKEDLELIEKHTWNKDRYGYAVATYKRKTLSVHVCLLGRREGFEIDHINRNKLDNRRVNLRFVTHSENMRNTDQTTRDCRGVWKKKNRYMAGIHINNKTVHLGSFLTFEEAQRARKEAEAFYWGNQANA